MYLSPLEIQALFLSIKVAITAVIGTLPFAILAGYILARWQSGWKALVELVVNLPLVLPPVVTGYLLLVLFGSRGPIGSFLQQTFGLKLTFTWLGAALASAVVSFPLMVRAIRLAFQNVDPRLEAAARSLGAGKMNTFFTISLPLAVRGIIAGSMLGFARSLGEFGATIMVAGNIEGETQTIPLAIFSLVQRPFGVEESWRLVTLSIIIACVALLVSEYFERKEKGRHAS